MMLDAIAWYSMKLKEVPKKYPKLPKSISLQKYPKNLTVYRKVPKSTEKYQKVPKSTQEYPGVPKKKVPKSTQKS